MNQVCIGNDCRRFSEADANWIASEIKSRERDGQCVCVRVTFDEGGLSFSLATPGCGAGGRGGRELSPAEARILELWNRHKLNEKDISPGNLVSFLRRF
jgi:hypothetical protein